MRIAIGFDGVVVAHGRHDDLATPLRFLPGARDGLYSLKRARHQLLLWSTRASPAFRQDPRLDPFVRAGRQAVPPNWRDQQRLNEARYQQMLEFTARELPAVFDAIDEGMAGKPDVDLIIDDKAVGFGLGPASLLWSQITAIYGEPDHGSPFRPRR